MKAQYAIGISVILLCCRTIHAQAINIDVESIGVISDASTGQKLGTGFITARNSDVVSCAHVVAGRTNLVYDSADETNSVRRLSLKYILPRFDLAVLRVEQTVPTKSMPLGDIRRIRPGDRIIYLGYKQGTHGIQANTAIVSATGAVLNDGAIVDFLEFQGEGLPGYSGGPVFDMSGGVVAVMREAWTKQGVKGGPQELINRAFSVGVLSTLEGEVFSGVVTPSKPGPGNLSLIEASELLKESHQGSTMPIRVAPTDP
jgi:S1-C subfamily serine protease